MKIILLVEGETERYLPAFLKRWIDPKLPGVGLRTDRFSGVSDYLQKFAHSAQKYLTTPDVAGVVGLIDFYGSAIPYSVGTVTEKCRAAKAQLESQVNHPRFRQHFAVHETEAWLFAQPEIFPAAISSILRKYTVPEMINMNHPPAKRLQELYPKHLNKKYGKPLEGSKLFAKLDPAVACEKCHHLKLLLDDLLDLAKTADH